MKQSILILLLLTSVLVSSAFSCNKEDETSNIENSNPMSERKIRIIANTKVFTATLLNNNAAKAFSEKLPLTINMTELNGNEKYYDFSSSLPTDSVNPNLIKNGDLMLYGSKTLVLFYQSFSTIYNYTKLGTIDNPTGLAAALGTGNVRVTFELD